MEQELFEEQEQDIKSGKILGFGYNSISIQEDDTNNKRVIYFDGLQKRVLSGYDESITKRLKRIQFTDTEEFWNIGINLFVCCDKCGNALFSITDEDDFIDKNVCQDCDKWLCCDCFNFENNICLSCQDKRTESKI